MQLNSFVNKKWRWRAILAAVLLTVAVILIAYNISQFSNPAGRQDAAGRDASTVLDPLNTDNNVREQAQQRYVQRAETLRGHWQKWAENHSVLLSKMMHASPSDTATLMLVYAAIPAKPGQGSDPGISGISHDDLHAPGALYTWNAFSKMPVNLPSDPLLMKYFDQSSTWFNNRMKSDFAKYHDVRIAESVNTGRLHVDLWASGRITTMQMRDFSPGRGQYIQHYDIVDKTIAPPYSFIH